MKSPAILSKASDIYCTVTLKAQKQNVIKMTENESLGKLSLVKLLCYKSVFDLNYIQLFLMFEPFCLNVLL